MLDITGPATVTVTVYATDPTAIIGPILTRLNALEAAMTAPFDTIDNALTALSSAVADLTTKEASDRAAFDALATAVRAFLSSLPTAGGTLTAEQATTAQAILDGINAAGVSDDTQAADEAALQGEVPASADPTV